jgi:arthrofactin-type cyclic lipopeptide synthetase C
VRSASAQFTYDQLNHAANRLAHELLGQDVRVGQRIALLLAHDGPLMAAMLGVLKAGKTCVVLAHAHPDARLESMLETLAPRSW